MCWFLILLVAWLASGIQADSLVFNKSTSLDSSFWNESNWAEQHHHHRLFPRAQWDPDDVASDARWNEAIMNGERFLCQMRRTDKDAGKVLGDRRDPPSAQSVFEDSSWISSAFKKNMRQWYWYEHRTRPNALDFAFYYGWKEALVALQIERSSHHTNHAFNIQHWNPDIPDPKETQHYTVSDKVYWVSPASIYLMHVNLTSQLGNRRSSTIRYKPEGWQ